MAWSMLGDGPGGGDMSWINDGFGCRRKQAKGEILAQRGRGKGKAGGFAEDRGHHFDVPTQGGRGIGQLLGNMSDNSGPGGYHERDFGRDSGGNLRRAPPENMRDRKFGFDNGRDGDFDRGRERDRGREWQEEAPIISTSWPPEEEPRHRGPRDRGHPDDRRGRNEHDRDYHRMHDLDRGLDRERLDDRHRRDDHDRSHDRRHHRSPERERLRSPPKERHIPEPYGVTAHKLETWETIMPETWEDKQKEFFCTLCNVQTSSDKSFEIHCKGRKHKLRAELFPEDDPWIKRQQKLALEQSQDLDLDRDRDLDFDRERGHDYDYGFDGDRDSYRQDNQPFEPEETRYRYDHDFDRERRRLDGRNDWVDEEFYEDDADLTIEERMARYYCNLCEVQTTSAENYEMHVNGMRHKANEDRQKRGEDIIKGSRNKGNRKKKKIAVDGTEIISIESIMAKCKEPLIGLENVIEYFRQEWQTETMYYCQMCETKFQQVNFIPHVTGYRHRYAYVKIKRPEMKDRCRVEPKGKETPVKVDGEIIVEKTPKRNRTDVLDTLKRVCNEIIKQEGQGTLQKGPDPDPPEMPINRLKKQLRSDSQVELKSLDPSEFKKPVTPNQPIPLGGGVKRPQPKQAPKEQKQQKKEDNIFKPPQPKPTIFGYQPPDVPPPGMLSVPSDLPPDAPPPTAMMMKPGARPLFPAGARPQGLGMPGMPLMPTMGAPMAVQGMVGVRPMPLPAPPRPPPPREHDLQPIIPGALIRQKHRALVEIEEELEREKKEEIEREMQRRGRDPYLDRLRSDHDVNLDRLREKDRKHLRDEDPFLASYIEKGRPPASELDRELDRRHRDDSPMRDRSRDRRRSPNRLKRSPDRDRRRSPGRDRDRDRDRRRRSRSRDRGRSPHKDFDPRLDRPKMGRDLEDLYSKEKSSSSRSKGSSRKSLKDLTDDELKRAFEERFGEKKSTSSNAIEEVVGEISKTLVQTGDEASMALRVSQALTKALLGIEKGKKEVKEDSPPPSPPGFYDPHQPTDMEISNSPEPTPLRYAQPQQQLNQQQLTPLQMQQAQQQLVAHQQMMAAYQNQVAQMQQNAYQGNPMYMQQQQMYGGQFQGPQRFGAPQGPQQFGAPQGPQHYPHAVPANGPYQMPSQGGPGAPQNAGAPLPAPPGEEGPSF